MEITLKMLSKDNVNLVVVMSCGPKYGEVKCRFRHMKETFVS
jgi:hypothetical protein